MKKLDLSVSILVLLLVLSSLAAPASTVHESKMQEAVSLLKGDNYADASKLLKRIVESNPLNAEEHYLYGESLYLLRKFTEAALEFKQASCLQPSNYSYTLRCAEAYLGARRSDEAVAVCNLALSTCNDEFYKKAFEKVREESVHPIVPVRTTHTEASIRGRRKS